jgi:hypothetical protein
MDAIKGDLVLSALTPAKDYDQTAMGLPLVTSVVFIIAKSF